MADVQYLNLTASFSDVSSPTPFAIYDTNANFATDANSLIRFVNSKLGGNVLQVELTNRDVYAALEQATIEYSGMINAYQAKSVLADIIGSPTGSLMGKEQKLAKMNLALAKRRSNAYGEEALVGGTKTLHSASIMLRGGQQNYDLNVLLSSSGILSGNQRAELREVFYFSPTAAYRFFDTTSAINYLHNQFSFESFTPETVFYLLPIWEDTLRAMELKQSFNIRRSHFSYAMVNNVLKIYPVPTDSVPLFFTYYLQAEDPFDDTFDPMVDGINNLSNVPFGNINYSNINSIGKTWIYRFAFAAAKETLGQIRDKVKAVPIPNGDLNLNGADLIVQAREEMQGLREDLKQLLESLTYQALAQQQAEEAENLQRQLQNVPMGIYIGGFFFFLAIYPMLCHNSS